MRRDISVIDHSIEILQNTPKTLESLFKDTSEIWRTHNEGKDTWSPTQVIQHLILAEKNNWIPRINIILSDTGNKEYKIFERMEESTKVTDINDLLDEFKSIRGKNIEILKSKKIGRDDLTKTGIHPEFGRVTLAQQISTWCVHDLSHISQICRVMAYQYRDEIGPWKNYIPFENIKKSENYRVENSTMEDLDFICWMYEEAIKYQKKNNYFGWESIDKIHLKNEIKNKLNFKITQGNDILCVFGVVFSDPLIWREKDKETSIYLHRIVVNPNFKGQKQFEKVLQWAKGYSVENGLDTIRMDTWTKNPAIIEFYKKYGFKVVEEYKTGDTDKLPEQHRNLDITLLEYRL